MNIKLVFLVLSTLFVNFSLFSQVTSSWISGSSGRNQNGTYGTKGTAVSSNVPGARTDAISWVDTSGNFWLFGGSGWAGGSQGQLNDLWKWDGSNWTWISGSSGRYQNGTYGTQGTAASSNVPGARTHAISWVDNSGNFWLFGGSGWAGGSQGQLNDLWKWTGSTLPVALIHFTTHAAANTTAELTWATATEIDNSHFVIERSYDGITFEAIDRLEGNGNSSEVLHYAYTDTHIAKGTKVVYYRLHQFDYNGASEYSDVRKVSFGMNNFDGQNIAIYPNPFASDVYIDLSTISGGEVTIQVTNIAGQQLLERSINNTQQIEKVDLSSLPKGIYFVNVTSDSRSSRVKVIKK